MLLYIREPQPRKQDVYYSDNKMKKNRTLVIYYSNEVYGYIIILFWLVIHIIYLMYLFASFIFYHSELCSMTFESLEIKNRLILYTSFC